MTAHNINAPISVEASMAAYWEERAKSTEARLSAEIQRCGRAEGALDAVQGALATARQRIATLQAEVDALRFGADDEDDTTLTPREVYGAGR